MPLFKKFCCCCTLVQGAILLGLLHAGTQLAWAVSTIISIVNSAAFIRGLSPHMSEEEFETLWLLYRIFLSISLSLNIVLIIFAVLLIVGAKMRNKAMLLPWMVTDLLSVVVTGCIFLAAAILMRTFWGLLYVIVVAVQIYLWLCVYSLFCQITVDRKIAACPKCGNRANVGEADIFI